MKGDLKRTWGVYLFFLLIILYGTERVFRWKKIIIPIVNSYLNDVLCLPIILGTILFVIRRWIIPQPVYYFSIYHILFSAVYFSLIFEWVLPHISLQFISDPMDILAYFLGGFLFYGYMVWERRPEKEELHQ